MDPAGFVKRKLCIGFVIKASALLVQMKEEDVLDMLVEDSKIFYNQVHEKIFDSFWSEMFSSVWSAS